jgi:hypothetical protein
VLYDDVGAREEEHFALGAVPPNTVRGIVLLSLYLDDQSASAVVSDVVTRDDNVISDGATHVRPLLLIAETAFSRPAGPS